VLRQPPERHVLDGGGASGEQHHAEVGIEQLGEAGDLGNDGVVAGQLEERLPVLAPAGPAEEDVLAMGRVGEDAVDVEDDRGAAGPILGARWWRSSSPNSTVGSTPPFTVTNATMACPVVSSLAPTTADSATSGWSTSADSTSVVEMRWPDTFITSSTRPSSHR